MYFEQSRNKQLIKHFKQTEKTNFEQVDFLEYRYFYNPGTL